MCNITQGIHELKILKNSKNLNEQLQKELFERYPEYKNRYY